MRDNSQSRGAIEDRWCLLVAGFAEFPDSFTRRYSPERVYGCRIKEGDSSCTLDAKELEDLNATSQFFKIDPIINGYHFSDRTPLEQAFGCSHDAFRDGTSSPVVFATPDSGFSRGGRKCVTGSSCSLIVSYEYSCLTFDRAVLPPGSGPDGLLACQVNFASCNTQNVALQASLNQCRAGGDVVVSNPTFTSTEECQAHVSACNLSNFQLNQALSQCRNG